ncbi:acyl-CoA dehydrogenase family protein [Actinospongicola halichondriae]|uniref:acyl-CoA dehydrogenase family protein n=1 Tax=Actinospongicola halichondriae TaxID=3236844 RepID=UPI003D56815F
MSGLQTIDDVTRWLDDHPSPSSRALADAGLVAPHYPAPWGLGADAPLQLAVDAALAERGIELPDNPIGVGWAGPTLVAGGSPEQQARWLPGLLDGSEFWCQLFSEPEAGSDLAALRTTAVRDGDEYVVDGQKIWSTWAGRSAFGILLARTDPSAPKHRGISYFVLDMSSPGIDVRPITEMTGQSHFNEVFLSDVRIPVDCRIGDEGDGWRLAKVTLGNERVSLSEGGVCWGMGPTSAETFEHLRASGRLQDPVRRQEAARLWIQTTILELLGQRVVEAVERGEDPTPIASLKKRLADVHGQELLTLVKDLRGPHGMLGVQDAHAEAHDEWHWAYLFSRALTIGGGTTEVLSNVIAEQLLGLPREPRPEKAP